MSTPSSSSSPVNKHKLSFILQGTNVLRSTEQDEVVIIPDIPRLPAAPTNYLPAPLTLEQTHSYLFSSVPAGPYQENHDIEPYYPQPCAAAALPQVPTFLPHPVDLDPTVHDAACTLNVLPLRQEGEPSVTFPGSGSAVRCSECSFFGKSDEVVQHAHTTHGSKPYACRVCGRCFSEKGNMNKHYRSVHLRQKDHRCSKCGKSFAFFDGLKRHNSMVHLDKRPFKCTHCICPSRPHDARVGCVRICGMRFKQKSHLRRHINSVHRVVKEVARV